MSKLPSRLSKEIQKEFIRRGILTEWLLYPEQIEFEDLYKKLKDDPLNNLMVATFCRRAGKTFTALAIAIQECLKNPGFKCVVFAPEKDHVKTFIAPIMEKLLGMFPEERLPAKAYNRWTFTNGATIEFRGTDYKGGTGSRGGDINLAILDEAGFMASDMTEFVRGVLTPSVELVNGNIMIISTPPKSMGHKYFIHALAAENEGYHIKRTIYQVTNYNSNPAKIRSIIKKMGGEDSVQFRREYMCEQITDPSARIVPEFEVKFHPSTEAMMPKPPEIYQPYCCIDFGFLHNTAVVFGYLDQRSGKFIVQDEIFTSKIGTDKLAAEILRIEKELWGPMLKEHPHISVRRFADNDLQLIYDLNSIYKLTVAPIQKISLNATVGLLRDRINSHFAISPKCKSLRYQLLHGIWDDKRKKFEEGAVMEADGAVSEEDDETGLIGHNDTLAALMYLNRHINWREMLKLPININRENQVERTGKAHEKPDSPIARVYKLRKFK